MKLVPLHEILETPVLLLLIAITFIRLSSNYLLNLDLHFDEAQYWAWSKDLDWGYYSKPPMVAWVISFFTFICSDKEVCIRSASPILHFFTALFVAGTAYKFKGIKAAMLACFVYILMPGVAFSSMLTTTDVPLLFFSSVLMYFLVFIVLEKKLDLKLYTFFGLACGFAMLSKYAVLLMLIGVFLGLFISPGLLKKLSLKGILLSIGIAFIIISPNIIWNFLNGFVTFQHTLDNSNIGALNLSLKRVFLFLFSQFAVFGPISIICVILSLLKFTEIKGILRILLFGTLGPLIIISLFAFISKANMNWAAIAYVPGSIFLSCWLLENKKSKLIFNIIIGSNLIFSIVIPLLVYLGPNLIFDPFYKMRGINEFGKEVGLKVSSIEDASLLIDDREDFAHMLYYIDPKPKKMAKWNGNNRIDDHFDLTTNSNDLAGGPVVLLTRTKPTNAMLARSNRRVKELGEIIMRKDSKYSRSYFMYVFFDWSKNNY
mgnify:CR=1 FL=1